jgi:hypothetical protein
MKTAFIKTIIIIVLTASYASSFSGQHTNDLKVEALKVLESKCNFCHNSQNPKKIFTGDNMEGFAAKIYKQVFIKKRMPKGEW